MHEQNSSRSSKASWPLAKAKAQLTALVDAAINRGPQVITRHGQDVAVVLSVKQYQDALAPRGSLVEFFANSPLAGPELELARP